MRLLKFFLIDLFIIWPALYFGAFTDGSLQSLGENLISFYGVFTLIVGTLVLLSSQRISMKRYENGVKPKSKIEKAYRFTAWVELIILASIGWYWCAAGWVIGILAQEAVDSGLDELHKSKLKDKAE